MAYLQRRVLFATPPIYQAPLPLEVHLPLIPQGPALLAAVLRERGHHVACFDAYEASCRQGFFDASAFAATVAKERPDWVGFSVYSDGFPAALRMIEIVRAVAPGCKIVVGGPHFTLFPEAVPPEVDVVVVGEGEIPMAALVDGALSIAPGRMPDRLSFRLQARDSETLYDGRSHFDFTVEPGVESLVRKPGFQRVRASLRLAGNGRTVILTVEDRLSNEALGRLPFPAYDLFLRPETAYQDAEPALGLDGPMMNLNTSRGCSYGCSFCSVEGVWGKPYTWFPSEWIVALVRSLRERFGIRNVFFREDEFIMKPRARSAWHPEEEARDDVLALAKGLASLGVRWAVENRVDAFGPADRAERYFQRLASLGLTGVFVGVESGSDRVRNTILNKHLSEASIRRFFMWAHEADVKTVANVMYGVRRQVGGELHSDGPADWLNTEVLLEALRPTRIDRYVYVGVPTSPMYYDHLARNDYEFIDVNGYLYPRGFAERAREIYGLGPTMMPVPGRPNVRVGPGLLPGIPVVQEAPGYATDRTANALATLSRDPDVTTLSLTLLGEPSLGQFQTASPLASLRPLFRDCGLDSEALAAVLSQYRLGEPPTEILVETNARLLVATVSSPSGEASLVVAHLRVASVGSPADRLQRFSTTVEHLTACARARFMSHYRQGLRGTVLPQLRVVRAPQSECRE